MARFKFTEQQRMAMNEAQFQILKELVKGTTIGVSHTWNDETNDVVFETQSQPAIDLFKQIGGVEMDSGRL